MRTIRRSLTTSYDSIRSKKWRYRICFYNDCKKNRPMVSRGSCESCERGWHSQRSPYILFTVSSLFEFFTFSYNHHLVHCWSQPYVVLSEESAWMPSTWSPTQSGAPRRMKPLFLHPCNRSSEITRYCSGYPMETWDMFTYI